MGYRTLILAFLSAALALLPALIGHAAAGAQQRGLRDLGSALGASPDDGMRVDAELVLAVDVSWSMDRGEQEIQRAGYAAAFRSEDVQKAILGGPHGRVAVAYIEWAGTLSQAVVVSWTLIDSREAADGFAYRLQTEEPDRERRTSISSAIDYAATLFDGNGYAGLRRVIDISGDGPNNQGRMVTEARDAAVARGIVINGLPLMTTGGFSSWGSIPDLDRYYADCVIGGPGAFMIPVNEWDQFPAAVRRKLVMELADVWPDPAPQAPVVVPVQNTTTSDCLIGERQWQERQRRWMEDF